jgi:hypothetical protein
MEILSANANIGLEWVVAGNVPGQRACTTDSEKGSFHRQFMLCARKSIYRQGEKARCVTNQEHENARCGGTISEKMGIEKCQGL